MRFGNQINIKNKNHRLYGEPLNSYWELIPNGPSLGSLSSTPLDKGYFAQWIITDGKLYLTEFEGSDLFGKRKYAFEDYFGKKGNLFFAFWFTGTLSVQSGKVVFWSYHFGDTLEYSFVMKFTKGDLIETNMKETI